MKKEIRLRCSALIFFMVLVIHFFLSVEGIDFAVNAAGSFGKNAFSTNVLIGILGIAIAFFASDAIGYLFNTITFVFLNIGQRFAPGYFYASEWRRLNYDFKKNVIDDYESVKSGEITNHACESFAEKYKKFSKDVFLSYFWQRAHKGLIEWVQRRHTAFYTSSSAIIALLLGTALPISLHLSSVLRWTCCNLYVLGISALLIGMFNLHAEAARKEARAMLDMWAALKYNRKIKAILQDYDEGLGIKEETGKEKLQNHKT